MRWSNNRFRLSALGFGAIGGLLGTVTANAATLELDMAGEAYEGPPGFAVFANDVEIGSGSVDNAIDTETEGRLTAANKSDHTQHFSFDFDDALLDEPVVFSIRLTTDSYGGPGTGLDQNLFVSGFAIDGEDVPLQQLTLVRADTEVPLTLKMGMAPMYKASDVLTYSAPDNSGMMADASPAAPSKDAPSAAEPAVETSAAEDMPSATETAAPAKTASAEAEAKPAAEVTCPDEDISIAGFKINSAVLPAGAKANLAVDEVPSACRILVTGYASATGPAAWNKELSKQRAKAVTDALTQAGVPSSRIRVIAGEETDKFGTSAASNQRVVVSFEAE